MSGRSSSRTRSTAFAAALLDLHQLDIDDKHRGLLEATAAFDRSALRAEIRGADDQKTITGTITTLAYPSPTTLRSGVPVGGYASSIDIRLVDIEPRPANIVLAVHVRGQRLRAIDFGNQMGAWIRFCHDTVRYGQLDATRRAIAAGATLVVTEPTR
jgi:hypothetical protein